MLDYVLRALAKSCHTCSVLGSIQRPGCQNAVLIAAKRMHTVIKHLIDDIQIGGGGDTGVKKRQDEDITSFRGVGSNVRRR